MDYRTKAIIKYLFFTIVFIIFFISFIDLIKEWLPLRNKYGFYVKFNELSIKLIIGNSLLIIMLYIIIYNFVFDVFQIIYYYNLKNIYYENITKDDLLIKYDFYVKYYFYNITTSLSFLLLIISFVLTYYWNFFFLLIVNILIIYFIWSIIIWRCPKCKKFLGWSIGIKKCKHCKETY
jgi:hypothetical protein